MGLSTHRWQPLGFWARIIENRDGRWDMGDSRTENGESRVATGLQTDRVETVSEAHQNGVCYYY